MNAVKEYRNFLSPDAYAAVKDVLLGSRFPWYYHANTSSKSDVPDVSDYEYSIHTPRTDRVKDSPQFVHTFFHFEKSYSDHFNLIGRAFLDAKETHGFSWESIVRMKANLITKDTSFPDGFYNIAHVDATPKGDETYNSLVYYVDDADGDTHIFNEVFNGEEVKDLTVHATIRPEANKAVCFPSNWYHASSTPRQAERRIVINTVLFNFKEKE